MTEGDKRSTKLIRRQTNFRQPNTVDFNRNLNGEISVIKNQSSIAKKSVCLYELVLLSGKNQLPSWLVKQKGFFFVLCYNEKAISES